MEFSIIIGSYLVLHSNPSQRPLTKIVSRKAMPTLAHLSPRRTTRRMLYPAKRAIKKRCIASACRPHALALRNAVNFEVRNYNVINHSFMFTFDTLHSSAEEARTGTKC